MKITENSQSLSGKWLSTSEYIEFILSHKSNLPLLQSEIFKDTLAYLGKQENLESDQFIDSISNIVQLNELPFNEAQINPIARLSQLAFVVSGEKILPAENFDSTQKNADDTKNLRVYFLSASLPQQKLTKKQFVSAMMQNRWSIIGLALCLGTPPVIAAAIAELLQQPLFDNFVPEGRIPVIILVGFATIILQLTAQLLTSMQSLAQSFFTQSLDLETKTATAQRFLNASTNGLPQKDIGSWRLTFSVASAYLGSINSLFISIPLAIISMIANVLVIGAFTDLSAVWNLFLILLIPTFLSICISYFSANISIRVIGQQSAIESSIYETVRQIKGIWMTNSQSNYINRFTRARIAMSRSILRSGILDSVSSNLNSLFQGLLYAFIFYQYYRSYLDPERTSLSVGSLLVIYFAIGSLAGSLSSIADDLVSVAQSLPTYWMPNAIRDISEYRSEFSSHPLPCPSYIKVQDLTYTWGSNAYPFKSPLNFNLRTDQSYAVIGPSGAGKSTLLSLLIGNLRPSTGSIELLDSKQQKLSNELTSNNLLFLSQQANLCGSRLLDVVDPSRKAPTEALEQACSELNLTQLLDELPLRWQTPVNEFSRDLSLGQLQRFKIARALLSNYDIIISDEATCHLPEDQHIELLRMLNQRSRIHISVLHRTSAIHLFDNVIIIDKYGKIAIKSTAEFLS